MKGSAGNSGITHLHQASAEAEHKVLEEDWDAIETSFANVSSGS